MFVVSSGLQELEQMLHHFRIFNPEVQSTKFDENNEYTTKWLNIEKYPSLPNEEGLLVDLSNSRKRALEVFSNI